MALRRNIKHYTPTFMGKLFKYSALLLLVLGLGIGGFILYFNGQHVKTPLLTFINEHSQVKFNAETVEFSPLYPNILKLGNVKVGKQGTIAQIYLEYDLKSLLSGHILVVKELFVQGVTLPEQTLRALLSQTLGFAGINFEKIRIEDANLTLRPHLEAASLSLTLDNVDLRQGKPAEIQTGTLGIRSGKLDGIPFKNLWCELRFLEDALQISKLQADTLSGSISGNFRLSQDGSQIESEGLVLSNLVLKLPSPVFATHSFRIPEATLHNLVLVRGEDLLLSGISGRLSDFTYTDHSCTGDLQGSIEEISLPSSQLTWEHNRLKFSRYANFSSLRLEGSFLEGRLGINLDFDETQQKIRINDLRLAGQKLELEEPQLSRLGALLSPFDIELISGEFTQLGLLSRLKTLPLSVREINGSLKGFNWRHDTGISGAPVGVVDLDLQDLLYQDLGLRQLKVISNLSADLLSLSLPEVRFNQSTFNLTASYSHLTNHSYLLASAHDFNLSELNCAMLPHLLDGRVNLELDLRGSEVWSRFPFGLKGYLKLKADNLLISKFGLDLINGGPSRNYELSGDQLLQAILPGDSGISNLEFTSLWEGDRVNFSSAFRLPVSQVSLRGQADLDDLNLRAKAYFISDPKDAITVVDASGTLKEPRFTLTAIARSEVRPGLYFDEEQTRTLLDAELTAKEQQNTLRRLLTGLREQALKLELRQQDALQQVLPYGEKTRLPRAPQLQENLPPADPSLSELEQLEQSILRR